MLPSSPRTTPGTDSTASRDLAGKVLKVTVFFAHFSDKAGFETLYGKYFPKDCPGRTSAAVTMLGKGILVELDAIAYV
jgi:2-iminobutanoate/2-iminopropanoate deaminase